MVFLRSPPSVFLVASVVTFPDISSPSGGVSRIFFGMPITKTYCRAMVLKLCMSWVSCPRDESSWALFNAYSWPPAGFKDPG